MYDQFNLRFDCKSILRVLFVVFGLAITINNINTNLVMYLQDWDEIVI